MFLGPRITTVFASRWKALGWSAGVLMTAYCSIPASQDDPAAASTDPAVSMMAALSGTLAPVEAGHNRSPWAIASPQPSPDR